jgi:hypothetical protein
VNKKLKALSGACLIALSIVAGRARAEDPPAHRPLPNIRAFPTTLHDGRFQAPLDRSALSTPSTQVESSPTLPRSPTASDALHVKMCERVSNIPGGKLADGVGRTHHWLIVQDRFGNTIHAAGMGNNQGIPGAGGQSSPDCPLARTFIRNHVGEIPRTCRAFPAIDPLCVISKTPYNQYAGRWLPYLNDCNTFARSTLNACQMPNLSSAPLLNAQTSTVWDRFGLLSKPEATSTYRLVGVDLSKSNALKP